MNAKREQTIAAIATAQGLGGVAIIRISGECAVSAAEAVFSAKSKKKLSEVSPCYLCYGTFSCGAFSDSGYAVRFAAPHSYTGEDVVELHCHGGYEAPRALLGAVLRQKGVRLADKGEFTRRAFLNGKLDLSGAEGVIDLIHAESTAEARAADRLLEGELGKTVTSEQQLLLDKLAAIEVLLDYPEEELPEESRESLLSDLTAMQTRLQALADTYYRGSRVKAGVTVALCGPANAGKSSLLNRLLGEERAIVSCIPGTTRDVVEGTVELAGVKVRLLDTAGIRESVDIVEQMGMERSVRAAQTADLVLRLKESEQESFVAVPEDMPTVDILTKADLRGESAGERADGVLLLSAATGEGIEVLRERLLQFVTERATGDGLMLTNERHYSALCRAIGALSECFSGFEDKPLDLVAFDLRAVWETLGEITGSSATEEILNTIFSRFCLGK